MWYNQTQQITVFIGQCFQARETLNSFPIGDFRVSLAWKTKTCELTINYGRNYTVVEIERDADYENVVSLIANIISTFSMSSVIFNF